MQSIAAGQLSDSGDLQGKSSDYEGVFIFQGLHFLDKTRKLYELHKPVFFRYYKEQIRVIFQHSCCSGNGMLISFVNEWLV